MNLLNKNVEERDGIIFGRYEPKKYLGGIRRFECDPSVIKELVSKGYADPNEYQNYSPTIEEFLETIEEELNDSDVIFECYAVSPERDDYRVTIEGINIRLNVADRDKLSLFVESFHGADEFSLDPIGLNDYALRAWWD